MSAEAESPQQAAPWAKWETTQLSHPENPPVGAGEKEASEHETQAMKSNTVLRKLPCTHSWNFLSMLPAVWSKNT